MGSGSGGGWIGSRMGGCCTGRWTGGGGSPAPEPLDPPVLPPEPAATGVGLVVPNLRACA
jgi:hypothetical protein